MYEEHTDGRLIAQLSDDELISVITRQTTQIAAYANVLNGDYREGLVGLLNENRAVKNNIEKTKSLLKMLDQSLKDYVIEAVTRDLKISELVQSAYGGRKTPIVSTPMVCASANDVYLQITEGK